jgi:hypothetical protein
MSFLWLSGWPVVCCESAVAVDMLGSEAVLKFFAARGRQSELEPLSRNEIRRL